MCLCHSVIVIYCSFNFRHSTVFNFIFSSIAQRGSSSSTTKCFTEHLIIPGEGFHFYLCWALNFVKEEHTSNDALRQHSVCRKLNSQTSLGMHVLWDARHTDDFQGGFPSPRRCIVHSSCERECEYGCHLHQGGYEDRTRQFPLHWQRGILSRCQLLSRHLHSTCVCTCIGLAFPLEKPLGGAKEWFWGSIILQGPWGRSPTFSVLEEFLHIWLNTAKRYSGSFHFTD